MWDISQSALTKKKKAEKRLNEQLLRDMKVNNCWTSYKNEGYLGLVTKFYIEFCQINKGKQDQGQTKSG